MTDYNKSNEEDSVRLNRFSKSYSLKLLSCGDCYRFINSQSLIDYLCKKFNIPNVVVYVCNRKRPRNRGCEIHGKYTRRKGDSPQITIYNKTAVKGDVISIKAFYDTLLHEFIHHYDYEVLKLDRSIHSAGFYKRISDLKNKL